MNTRLSYVRLLGGKEKAAKCFFGNPSGDPRHGSTTKRNVGALLS